MPIAQVDIGGSLETGLNAVVSFVPKLIAFLLLLLIGFIVAKLVKAIVTKLLEKVGVDQKLDESNARSYVDRVMPGASPSNGIGRVLFYFVFAFFVVAAIGTLQIPALTDFMNQVLAYIPNIIAAIAIFILAALIAGAVGGAVARTMGDTPTGKIVGTVAPALVMVIAVFMILSQLGIAPNIVQIAFAATIGALALGLALAFGLGGRPVAERMLNDAYRKGQEQREQVRSDLQRGRDQAQADAERGKQRAQQEAGQGSEQQTRSEQPTQTQQPPGDQPPGGSYRAT